jgi:prolyl oligopeptidase
MNRAILLALLVAAATARAGEPPPARASDVSDDRFGIALSDPYRWMEAGGDELNQWLKAQGDATAQRLAALPGRDRLAARVEQLSLGTSYDKIDAIAGAYRFQHRLEVGKQLPMLVAVDARGRERVIVDPVRLAGKGGHISLDNFAPSFDGKRVACNLAEGGGEVTTIRVYDTATGRELGDRIERVWGEFPVHWLPDGKRFFYTQMAAPRRGVDRMLGMSVRLHVLGRPVSEDKLILGPGKSQPFAVAPQDFPKIDVPPGSDWMVATSGGAHNEIRVAVAPLSALDGPRTPWRIVAEYADSVESWVVFGSDLVLLSSKQASNRRLLRVPLTDPSLAQAQVLVPEDAQASIEDFAVTRDALLVVDQQAGRARVRKLARGQSQLETLTLPYPGWVSYLVTDPLQSDWYLPLVTWTRPVHLFHAEAKGFVDSGLGERSPADFSGISAEDVDVVTDDGAKVPLTILAKKGLARDGSHPTVLYGYGGYGSSVTPSFNGALLAWLERGGVYAFAHVRGGGEKGHAWHVAGQGKNKPRGVKDFIACAAYLTQQRWTSVAKLAAYGGSMGGVLVGRAITERPDQFGAAVISVGMLNAVRYLEANNGANQTLELTATPDSADGLKTLLAMDAYHNLKPGVAYPALMLTIGANDERVSTWESAKFTARLQALHPKKPALLRLDNDAGHGIGSTRSQTALLRADGWAFMLWQAGDPEFQPKK